MKAPTSSKPEFCKHNIKNFRPNDFKPEYKQFYMSISKLKGLFVRWNKDNSVANKTYQDTFFVQNWGKLSKAKKEQHMLIKCKGC